MKKIEWLEVARRGKAHHILFLDSVMALYQEKLFGSAHNIAWNPKYYRQFNDARWFSKEDFNNYTTILQEGEEKKKGYLLENAKEYDKRITSFRNFINMQRDINYSSKNKDELVKVFSEWFQYTKQFWCFGYDYIFINKFLPDEIVLEIARKEKDIIKQNQYLGVLFTADKPSELWEEKKSCVLLVKFLKEHGFNEQFKKKLSTHKDKFAHLGYYYFRGQAFTEQEVLQRIEEYRRLSDNEFNTLLKDLKEQELCAQKSEELMAFLSLDESIKHKIKIIKSWAALSNYVDETYSYGVHKLFGLWQEIGKRLGLARDELFSLRAEEIIKHLQKGTQPDKEIAAERFRNNAFILENGNVSILIGNALAKYNKEEQKEMEFFEDMKELKGQVASPGIVCGKVRIVYTLHDIRKFERGEILVSSSTNPTYMPAMEKAAAIVTDEGGLLSHAAIVSRELKVPCVVSTKYATKVLKDGMLVEVDAVNGCVKRL